MSLHRLRAAAPAVALAALAALAPLAAPAAPAAPLAGTAAADSVPPPPPDTSFIRSVVVTGVRHAVPCPGESLRVTVSGVFPSDCFSVRRIEAPPIWCVQSPCLPLVQLLYDDGGCLGRPCVIRPVPFEARITLPPLAAGEYLLPVWDFVASCVDTFPDRPLSRRLAGVRVACDTLPGPSCLAYHFVPWGTPCDAVIGDEGPAVLGLWAGAAVPLAGLQGELRLRPDSLRITALEAVGAAAGMNLSWVARPDGADFVMFSASGAPLPPAGDFRSRRPVLEITVAPRPGVPVPPRTSLIAARMFASDTLGRPVYPCPITVIIEATICADRPCDANGDGRTDVRDLVLMARCLRAACPDSARFDCDGDGRYALADLLCCARRMLGGGPAPGEARPSRAGLTIEAPRATPEGWEFDVVMSGALDVGAADVGVAFPAERMTVTGTRLDPGVPGWLALHEVRDGALRLGLVRLEPDREGGPDVVRVTVRVALKPGAAAGGEVTLAASALAGPDGAAIDALVTPAAFPISAPPALALSPAQPNPFAGETRVVASLARPADVDLGVFDLAGRRVATLHRGRLAAGEHAFAWSGRADRGGRARDGVYFIQVDAGGERSARKVVLLGAR